MRKRNIVANVVWLSVEHLSKVFGALATAMLLTRALGVDAFGEFQYALGLTLVFSALGLICGSEILVPKLTNLHSEDHRTEAARQVKSAFTLRAMFSALGVALLLMYALLKEPSSTVLTLLFFAVSMLLNEPFGVMVAWFQARTFNRPKVMVVISGLALKVLIIFTLFQNGVSSTHWFAAAWSAESLFIAGLFFALYRHRFGDLEMSAGIDWVEVRNLFKDGLPFFGGLMFMLLFQKMDLLLLRKLSSPETLGLYAAAQQVTLGMTAFSTVVCISLAPALVYRISNRREIIFNVLKISALLTAIGMSGGVVFYFLSDYLILIVFGEKFSGGADYLRVLSFVAVLAFLEAGLNLYNIRHGFGGITMIKWGLAVGVSLFVSVLLIPLYGGLGAAFATAAGYASACCVNIFVILWNK